MGLSIAAGTAISGALSAAGSVAATGMGNAKNMRMYRKQVAENRRIRDEDYARSLENREYNSAASQMKRLTDAGMSAGGAASSVLGSNASSSMSTNISSGSPGSGASSPDLKGPDFSRAGSVFNDAVTMANVNADTLVKQQEANLTKINALGAEYDNAIKSNNADIAASTKKALIEARYLDNLLTEQRIYQTEADTGLTRAKSFNEWRNEYYRRMGLEVDQLNAASNAKNAETSRLDYLAKSPYYSRVGLSPTVNFLSAAGPAIQSAGKSIADILSGSSAAIPAWLGRLLGGSPPDPSGPAKSDVDAANDYIDQLVGSGRMSYADARKLAYATFGLSD